MKAQKQHPSLVLRILDAKVRAEGQLLKIQSNPVPPDVRNIGERHR